MITLIYNNNSTFLSKKEYLNDGELINKFPDYVTNLKFPDVHELIKFMVDDGYTSINDLRQYIRFIRFVESESMEMNFEEINKLPLE